MDTLPVGPKGTGFRSSRMVAMGPPKGAAATLWFHCESDVSFAATTLHSEPLQTSLLCDHAHDPNQRDVLMTRCSSGSPNVAFHYSAAYATSSSTVTGPLHSNIPSIDRHGKPAGCASDLISAQNAVNTVAQLGKQTAYDTSRKALQEAPSAPSISLRCCLGSKLQSS